MAEYDSPAEPTAGALHAINPSPQAINRSPQATSPNSQASQPSKLSYMQRPPAILPNYGKRWKHGRSLKTNLPRVLLYDNVTQQSILDAQVSYIQSQRSKSKRHLEMNIKSFLLWKERKDKALQKLTQVQHGQDYAHFELQYYGRIVHTNNTIPGNGDNRFGLSNIRGEEIGEKAVITTRRENCTENLRDCLPGLPSALKKELQTKLSRKSLDVSKQSQRGRAIHLPCIKKTFRSQKINNGDYQVNSAPQCFQQRNKKLHIVQKSSEVTNSSNLPFNSIRIQDNEVAQKKQASIISSKDTVNNLTTATDENSLYCGAGTKTSFSGKPSTVIKNVTASNNSKKFRRNNNLTRVSDENEINDGVDTAKKGSQKQSMEINKVTEHNNSKDFLQNKHVKIQEPILDKRFLQLQKILIRQCPPSEGFTVLSPSFKKRKSFHY